MDWKTVVDEAPVAMIIINGRGEVVYVNKILLERSGLSFEEATKHPEKYFHLKITKSFQITLSKLF